MGGGLAARGVTSYWPTLTCGYAGVLLGDVLIHHWGKRIGPAAYGHRMVRKHMSPQRQEKLRAHFARHGFWTIVVGRHTPMLRAPIFFLAGASRVPLWKFALADAVSAAVTVPIVVTLGYEFAEHMDDICARIHHAQWLIAAVLAFALAGLGVLEAEAEGAGGQPRGSGKTKVRPPRDTLRGLPERSLHGAAGNRTRTPLQRPGDFKSAASASSATAPGSDCTVHFPLRHEGGPC